MVLRFSFLVPDVSLTAKLCNIISFPGKNFPHEPSRAADSRRAAFMDSDRPESSERFGGEPWNLSGLRWRNLRAASAAVMSSVQRVSNGVISLENDGTRPMIKCFWSSSDLEELKLGGLERVHVKKGSEIEKLIKYVSEIKTLNMLENDANVWTGCFWTGTFVVTLFHWLDLFPRCLISWDWSVTNRIFIFGQWEEVEMWRPSLFVLHSNMRHSYNRRLHLLPLNKNTAQTFQMRALLPEFTWWERRGGAKGGKGGRREHVSQILI